METERMKDCANPEQENFLQPESGALLEESEQLKKARVYEKENRAEEACRPKFHLIAPVGWINDPNGFSEYRGRMHLFEQYYPYDNKWGPMHWGHHSSDDLVVWTEEGCAMAPDSPFDIDGCFSGTAIETDQGHLLIYTGVSHQDNKEVQNQCLAIGDGHNYRKYRNNPVIAGDMLPEGFSRKDFRDPKIFRANGKYYVIAGSKDEKGLGQTVLFSSDNLRDWKYEKVFAHSEGFGKMWECPDFFELDGQGMLVVSPQYLSASRDYEFHNGHNSVLFPGEIDWQTMDFAPEQPVQLDYGFDFYAPQTAEKTDGRRIMIGWLQSWDTKVVPDEHPWSGMMSFPRELSYENGHLKQRPVRELENYRSHPVEIRHLHLEGRKELPQLAGRFSDLIIRFEKCEFSRFTLEFAAGRNYGMTFTWNRYDGMIEFDRTFAGHTHDVTDLRKAKEPEGGIHTIRLIQDLNSAEIFVNDGEMVFSSALFTDPACDQVILDVQGSAVLDIEKYAIEVPDQAAE